MWEPGTQQKHNWFDNWTRRNWKYEVLISTFTRLIQANLKH